MNLCVIPQPKSIKFFGCDPAFELAGGVKVFAEGFGRAAAELDRFIYEDLKMLPEEVTQGVIAFHTDALLGREAYRIKVSENAVDIFASTDRGAFYAVQTLKQLFVSGEMTLPELMIEDEPEFEYRGFMLDCARHFFTKEEVFSFLDITALHKLNHFHWHLTDDQGWRLELYCKLALAQVGGFRAGTDFDRKPHGGFYSQDDVREIVAYARERFITVVPELDSPGHSVAAIAAYPELSCFGRQLSVATHGGVKHDVICVGKETSFEFMKRVWGETISLFGSVTIHIGGNEVPAKRWSICPVCLKRMSDEGIDDPVCLLTYYLNRLSTELKEFSAKPVVWCGGEAVEGIDEETVIEFCGPESSAEGFEKAAGKRKIINACSDAYCFDLPLGKLDLREVFEYDPNMGDNVIGTEACLWTEHVSDFESACIKLFPRLAAFSESAWGKADLSFEDFFSKLDSFCFMLSAYGYSCVKPKRALPSGLSSFIQNARFGTKRLDWQKLHRLFDDRIVKQKAKKSAD